MSKPMHILIGSDHAGFELKHHIKEHLRSSGYEVTDKGTHVSDSVDYPDYAHAVAQGVSGHPERLGVVICGSGNGVNITANKHIGVRSALAWNTEVASLARQHNNANVLALPARFVTKNEALAIIDAFLGAEFEGGRHQRRVELIESGQRS
jgi:ribose 5-phosphate isomerase B